VELVGSGLLLLGRGRRSYKSVGRWMEQRSRCKLTGAPRKQLISICTRMSGTIVSTTLCCWHALALGSSSTLSAARALRYQECPYKIGSAKETLPIFQYLEFPRGCIEAFEFSWLLSSTQQDETAGAVWVKWILCL
jgi:hypothetical protein